MNSSLRTKLFALTDHKTGAALLGATVLMLVVEIALKVIGEARFATQLAKLTSDGIDEVIAYSLPGIVTGLMITAVLLGLVGILLWAIGDTRSRHWANRVLEIKAPLFFSFIICLSFLVNLIFVLTTPYKPVRDFLWYHINAINLAQGKDLITLDGVRPTAWWPVGYPLFLAPLYALFGPYLIVAQIANIITRLVTAVLTYLIGRHMFSEKIARVGFLIMAFFPGLMLFTIGPCSDLLFGALFAMVIYLLISYDKPTLWHMILLGIVLGAAAYVRPVILAFIAIIGFWYWIVTRQPITAMLRTAFISVIAMIIILPWTYRNYRVFGEPVLISTNGGVNLLIGNNPYTTGGATLPPGINIPEGGLGGVNEPVIDRSFRDRAVSYIISNPAQFLLHIPIKLFNLYARTDESATFAAKATYSLLSPVVLCLFILIPSLYYFGVLAAAALSLIHNPLWAFSVQGGLIFLLAVGLITGIYLFFFGTARYVIPLYFAFSLVAATSICPLKARDQLPRP